jgi:indoleamine 2,3-dioxygenase
MPQTHRTFLHHLSSNPWPLRALVLDSANDEALKAYNAAVQALKGFRDAHIRIVTIYIMGPARHAQKQGIADSDNDAGTRLVKGTGGTDLATFLKSVRDLTAETIISEEMKFKDH